MSEYLERGRIVRDTLTSNQLFNLYKKRILEAILDNDSSDLVMRSSNTTVYRIGIINVNFETENIIEMPLALRVPSGGFNVGWASEHEINCYCENAEKYFEGDFRVPAFCLPVKYHSELDGLEKWFALLTEDLTDYGRYKLEPMEEERHVKSRTIMERIPRGKEEAELVRVDLGPRSCELHLPSDLHGKFTSDEYCLDLTK